MIRRASYNEPALTPLPYNTEISDNNTIFNPRSSFTKHLQRSSYLFPKRKSSSSDTDKQQSYPRTMNRVTLDHHDSNKKMRYNDSDSNMRLKELYSVSAFEDTPTISQSPTDARGDMNMKQDQHCNVKPPPLCSLTTDNNDEKHVTNIMTDSIMTNKNNNSSNRKKKSVSFHPQVSTNYPSSNSIHASTSTSSYKTQLWYTSSEYDQFKYQAALDCGIKLMQSNNVSSSQKNDGKKRRKRGPQYIQIGDFDCKKNENINDNTTSNVAASYSSSSMDTMPTDNTKDEKFSRYYNENEYKDQVSSTAVDEQNSSTASHGRVIDLISNKPQKLQQEEPTVVCKRGLGYHFSRTRKRARMSTRSALLAWQKNLRGASNTSSSRATANDKSIMMLALVSSKCSRVAREEAKWRGLVDYKVAYPERHQELLHQQPSVSSQQPFSYFANEKVQFDNDMNMNDKKRPHDESAAAPIIHFDIASRCTKRQRYDNNDNGHDTNKMQRRNGTVFDTNNNRDELILSPETVGYLVSGVQYAKV